MKVKEFLEKLAISNPELLQWNKVGGFESPSMLLAKDLPTAILEQLLLCDEFKKFDKVTIVEMPNFLTNEKGNVIASPDYKPIFAMEKDSSGVGLKLVSIYPEILNTDEIPVHAVIYKLPDDDSTLELLGKNLYLHSFMFSPPICDFTEIGKRVGVVSYPATFNPENFEPLKTITITYSPEKLQDAMASKEGASAVKEEIFNKVNALLESGEVTAPIKRSIMMRCAIGFKK